MHTMYYQQGISKYSGSQRFMSINSNREKLVESLEMSDNVWICCTCGTEPKEEIYMLYQFSITRYLACTNKNVGFH